MADMVSELQAFLLHDPIAKLEDAKREYGITL